MGARCARSLATYKQHRPMSCTLSERMGFGLYRRNTFIFIKGASFCFGCNGLLYEVDRGSTIKEYDTPRGNKLCIRTYSASVWDSSNLDNRSRGLFHVLSVQRVRCIIEDQIVKFLTVLCSSKWPSRIQQ
jgi:hypothetical protein